MSAARPLISTTWARSKLLAKGFWVNRATLFLSDMSKWRRKNMSLKNTLTHYQINSVFISNLENPYFTYYAHIEWIYIKLMSQYLSKYFLLVDILLMHACKKILIKMQTNINKYVYFTFIYLFLYIIFQVFSLQYLRSEQYRASFVIFTGFIFCK